MIIEIVPVSEQRKHLCIVLFKLNAVLKIRAFVQNGRIGSNQHQHLQSAGKALHPPCILDLTAITHFHIKQDVIHQNLGRISPRFAISLLILIFLLIPFRQSCRIGYNVRDLLSKNIGVLRCNHRTACFSFSCCSSHATRIF